MVKAFMYIKLNNRLQAVARMVTDGANVVDIGTDHGHLPIFLAIHTGCERIIATDIKEQPLARARTAVYEEELNDRIVLRLSDGLDEIDREEVDEIVIAGLGGDTILDILERAPWLQDQSKAMVLQPMTKAERLRKYLINHRFVIEREEAVRDGNHLYTVMRVHYSGLKQSYPEYYYYIGELEKTEGKETVEYLQNQMNRLKVMADGMEQGKGDSEKVLQIRAMASEIEAIIQNKILY